jgi:hypothetical protein
VEEVHAFLTLALDGGEKPAECIDCLQAYYPKLPVLLDVNYILISSLPDISNVLPISHIYITCGMQQFMVDLSSVFPAVCE